MSLMTEEERKQQFAYHGKLFRNINKRRAAENEQIYKMVCEGFGSGEAIEVTYEKIREEFGLKNNTRIKNVIRKFAGCTSLKAKNVSDQLLIDNLLEIYAQVNRINGEIEYELDQLDLHEEDGNKWIEVSQTETENTKKGTTTSTHKISTDEQRRKLHALKLENSQAFIKSVGQMLPKNIVNIANGGNLQQRSLQEIEAEIQAVESRKIKNKGIEI